MAKGLNPKMGNRKAAIPSDCPASTTTKMKWPNIEYTTYE